MPRNREKYNAYFRAYYRKHKQAYFEKATKARARVREQVDAIKRERGCKFCPEKEPICLDFHHLDSEEKEQNVSRWVISSSLKKALAEIEKCICVCSNCHRKIHAGIITISDDKC